MTHRSSPSRAAPTLLFGAKLAAFSAVVALLWAWLGLGASDQQGSILGVIPADPSDKLPAQTVQTFEYGFEPSRLVIKVGQVVSWRAVGDEVHVVTPASAATRQVFSGAKRLGSSRHVFRQPGTYPYYCSVHPRMRGTVVVRRTLE